MKNNIIGLTITLAVGILLIGSLLAPTITGITDLTKTYTNEGMPFAEVDDDTHTIVLTSSAITVDGEEIDQSLFPGDYTYYTIVYGSENFIRVNLAGTMTIFVGENLTNFSYASNTVTVTIVGSTATVTTTSGATTATMTGATHYISTSGNYVMAENPRVNVNSESTIVGAGHTSFTTPNTSIYTTWSGTIDSVTASVIRAGNVTTATVSSTEVNTTEVDGDLVRIDSVLVNYDVTASDTDYDLTSTYTYFLAPASVTYDNPNYIGDGAAALLSTVVIILILAMLVGATHVFRRD